MLILILSLVFLLLVVANLLTSFSKKQSSDAYMKEIQMQLAEELKIIK